MIFNTSYPHIITDDSLMETASHGSIEYPFQFYDENMEQFDFNCVDWHWHTELEFVLVENGYVTMRITGLKSLPQNYLTPKRKLIPFLRNVDSTVLTIFAESLRNNIIFPLANTARTNSEDRIRSIYLARYSAIT